MNVSLCVCAPACMLFRGIQAHMGGHTLIKKHAHQPLQSNTHRLDPLSLFATSPHMHTDYVFTAHIYIPLTKKIVKYEETEFTNSLCASKMVMQPSI